MLTVATLTCTASAAGLAATSGGTSAGCSQARFPVTRTIRLRVGRLWRSAVVTLPAIGDLGAGVPSSSAPSPGGPNLGVPSSGLPLVVAFHGWGGSGPQMARYSGLSVLAARAHFMVAYPSSHGLGWNATGAPRGAGDLAFTRELVLALERYGCADPAAVFATGVSNGGAMVALVGCRLSSLFRAIAPVAGDYGGQPACHPARPLSVLEIHGTADPVVPYFGPSDRPTADGVPPFVNAWVARDACGPAPAIRLLALGVRLYRWARCRGGAIVEHVQIRGGRHQWPGATPPDPGPRTRISAAATIWGFFAALLPA